MKKFFSSLIISLFIGLIFLLLVFLAYVNISNLKTQLTQAKNRLNKIQAETAQLQTDKEDIAKDNKKLKAEISSYVASNEQLQGKQDELQQTKEEMDKTIKAKEDELKILKQKLEKFKKENKELQTQQTKFFLRERDKLKNKVSSLDATLKEERALYHYNLGVAYSQIKFYAEAINEYEKSLMFNSNNPDAHYNLGILYGNFQGNPAKAKEHYRQYLELKPNAEDKAEVESWIKRIQEVH